MSEIPHLAASEDGLALYQSLGQVRRPQPTLSLILDRRLR